MRRLTKCLPRNVSLRRNIKQFMFLPLGQSSISLRLVLVSLPLTTLLRNMVNHFLRSEQIKSKAI
jgi:hypothetical protein